MSNNEITASFIVLIAGREQKDALLTALSECGAQLVNTLYGKGSANKGYLENMFGFVTEEAKVVITAIANDAKTEAILALLDDKFGFNEPNTGIAFTVPVDKIVF